MKKVGILTYHRAINYGAVLQSYSLVTYLKKRIPDASFEIIDYASLTDYRSYIKRVASYLIKHFDVNSAKGELKKRFVFQAFSNSLPISNSQFISDDITQLNDYINRNYDIVISGSDAIFNWNGQHFPTPFFLHDITKVKMTYAASAHRLFYKDAEKNKLYYILEALESLDYFGARDKETENLAKYCGYNGPISHNCDPALLLDIDSIHKTVDVSSILKKCGVNDDRPIIIVMTPDSMVADAVKAKYNKEFNIISLFINNHVFSRTIYSLTPFEWATLFSKATITITEYFHATILSLLNGTPVLALDSLEESLGYEGKIKDLLYTRLSLPDLYLNKKTVSELGTDIVTNKVDDILQSFRLEESFEKIKKETKSADSFVSKLSELI